MNSILEIADKVGIERSDIELYGNYKAKIESLDEIEEHLEKLRICAPTHGRDPSCARIIWLSTAATSHLRHCSALLFPLYGCRRL